MVGTWGLLLYCEWIDRGFLLLSWPVMLDISFLLVMALFLTYEGGEMVKRVTRGEFFGKFFLRFRG